MRLAKKIHGENYDYSNVDYKNSHTKVKINCPQHGSFEQIPQGHLQGCGCPKCGIIKCHLKSTKTTEQFIKDAKKIHRNKYSYGLVDYRNSITKIKIVCEVHGIFKQTPQRRKNDNYGHS